ncbi:MAG: HAMP domain-containing protein [Candidatus Delongbacteria bacterium]|nr:HAMP domain-containing protein [Candidatus Delongbacteria bacterium]MBN2834057.1 HAMP domain-containing protein [Candidatus Delongbacteria bacterium]
MLKTLSAKLITLLVVAMAIIVFVSGLIDIKDSESSLYNELVKDAEVISDNFALNVALPLYDLSDEGVDNVVKVTLKFSQIAMIVIKGQDDSNFVRKLKIDEKGNLQQIDLSEIQNNNNFIKKEIKKENESLGYAYVYYSKKAMEEKLSHLIISEFITQLILLLVVIIVTFILLKFLVIKPVGKIEEVLRHMSEGDFDIKADFNSNDEIGKMSVSIDNIRVALKSIENEMDLFVKEIGYGNILYRGDLNKYEGLVRKVVENVNLISSRFSYFIDSIPSPFGIFNKEMICLFMNKVALSVANITKEEFGKKKYYDVFDKVELNDLMVSKSIKSGKNESGDANVVLKGKKMYVHFDSFPIRDENGNITCVADIVTDLTDVKAAEQEAGRAAEEAKDMQSKSDKISDYQKKEVQKLSSVLNQVSDGDLRVEYNPNPANEITKESYDMFNGISSALKNTLNSLSAVINQISVASSQINSGAEQLSDASQSLSAGSTEQSSSIEELTATMTEISSQTRQNAENANMAAKLAAAAREASETGSTQMSEMNAAILEINDSSQEIKKVIKVIDDIAFQTNLLALNAAVEAARAGIHGKGFAVVADEVRNLAQRSAEAAKETTELIESSVKRVAAGTKLAEETVHSLENIRNSVIKTVDLVEEIAVASEEQAKGIEQSNVGLTQVSKVTQQNASNAEETAAASIELSSQADNLRETISHFKIVNQPSSSNRSLSSNRPTSTLRKSQPKIEEKRKSEPMALPKPKTIAKAEVLNEFDDDDFGDF